MLSRIEHIIRPFLPALGAALLGTLLTGCGQKQEAAKQGKTSTALQAEVTIVQSGPLQSSYQTSGTLLPNESVQIYPEMAGRVTAIHFKEGTNVHKGDLLVQLYDEDVRAQIRKLQAQKQLQLTTKDRQDELLHISGVSRQEYDETMTQIASTDADIAYYETLLRRLQVRAPFDGKIGLRQISTGAVISPATLITEIQQINPVKLDFPLPDQYKDMVPVGSAVHFTVTGISDTMEAKIIASASAANASTRTVAYRAQAPNSKQQLVPGAFANVYVSLNRNEAAITIPSQCIIPTNRDKQVAVLRNGKAVLVPVKTGMRLVETIEITQGLKIGDTVLTTGIMQVKPGMEIDIAKIVSE